MKTALAALLALCVSAPAFAGGHAVTPEVIAAIEAKLVVMRCQMDTDDIEVEDDGYELDDVICEGGNQFDIELDMEINETGRRAE